MEIISGLRYSKEHEWVRVEGKNAYIGITDYAQHSLGEIVFIDLPQPGVHLNSGDGIGVVESVKAASDIYTPLAGKVLEVNGNLADDPGMVNKAPFESWFAVVEFSDPAQLEALMDSAEYEKFCAEGE